MHTYTQHYTWKLGGGGGEDVTGHSTAGLDHRTNKGDTIIVHT